MAFMAHLQNPKAGPTFPAFLYGFASTDCSSVKVHLEMNRIHPVAWRVLLFLLKNQLLKLTCIEAIISTQIIQPALHVIPLAERMKTVNLNLESSSLNEKNYMKSLEDFLSHTLREVFSGPLAKKHIHLYVDAEVEGLVDIDRLLVHINKPLSLARHFVNGTSLNYLASEEVGEIYDFDALNPYSENESIPDESILQSRGYNHQYNTGTVFVYVKHGKLETISSPPLATSYAGLLLVSLQEDCNINTIRQVPLSSETASVALMCLTRKGDLEVNPKLTLSFQVFTWLPFHPKDRLHSLGTWSSDTFPEWEQLFIDRFESFEGSTLHVSSDDSDMPFFFNIDNVTFDGTSKRIMDELGEWINFSFTFTKSASDAEQSWMIKAKIKCLPLEALINSGKLSEENLVTSRELLEEAEEEFLAKERPVDPQ
ncbi:uncharacterized protein [Palaemon carinicauda]|uniref:uncharacterized protein n=1 Tax=Palaemon carinicauda TaxID=392227 RepID=UPI0035B63484